MKLSIGQKQLKGDVFSTVTSLTDPRTRIPSDVVGLTTDPKGKLCSGLNPDFDPSVTYVPREESR